MPIEFKALKPADKPTDNPAGKGTSEEVPALLQERGIDTARHDLRQEIQRKITPLNQSVAQAEELEKAFKDQRNRTEVFSLAPPAKSHEQKVLEEAEHAKTFLERHGMPAATPPTVAIESNRQLMQEVMQESTLSLDDLLPYRIHAAWRICRELGRIRGYVLKDLTIRAALSPRDWNADPWTIPRPMRHFPTCNQDPPSDTVMRLALEADKVEGEARYSRFDSAHMERQYYQGLAILPPPPAHHWYGLTAEKGMVLSKDYHVQGDKLLLYYIAIAAQIADEWQMDMGSEVDPKLGKYGLMGLFDPNLVRLAWPDRDAICFWEETLVQQVVDALPSTSMIAIKRLLRRKYAINDREAMAIIHQGKQHLHEMMQTDSEQDKSLMIARLDDFIDRARSSGDMRAEIQGLKQLSIVQGLARLDSDSDMGDIMEIMKRVSSEKSAMAPGRATEHPLIVAHSEVITPIARH